MEEVLNIEAPQAEVAWPRRCSTGSTVELSQPAQQLSM
jgi:hypothetical protein